MSNTLQTQNQLGKVKNCHRRYQNSLRNLRFWQIFDYG